MFIAGLRNRRVPMPRRWEIWEVRLDATPEGREQAGTRPCVVISRDAFNLSGLATVVVCPMTTIEREKFVWRPRVDAADLTPIAAQWSAKPSWVQTDQVVTLDVRRRVHRHLATLSNSQRRTEIEIRLREILGLD